MSTPSQIVLVTGATGGIGRETALHLARRGHRVIATGRKPADLEALRADAAAAGLRLDVISLEVTSAASIAAAVAEVDRLTDGHGLDVLVNNAGFGITAPTSETPDAEVRRVFETNVFGLLAVTRAFLPRMRDRRAGRIVNVSSVAGRITLPYFGVYNATKYAVESLSDALRYELRPFGVGVVLIEPGIIRTRFEATAGQNLAHLADTPYRAILDHYDAMSRSADRMAAEPIVVAKAIARAVAARRPAARYVAPLRTNLLLWLRALAPTSVWDWAMRRMGKLDARTLCLGPAVAAAPAGPVAAAPPASRATS